jgi:DNA polymerase-1
LKEKYNARKIEIKKELTELVGHDLNVNSWQQVAVVLYQELRCPLRKDTGEDTLVALMNNAVKDEKRKRVISLILEGRRVRKTISTYLDAKADFDGRMRCSYRICGTETGRSSTSIMEPPVRPIKIGIAFQTMTKHGDTGADLRRMFVPDPGHVFVEVDLSQAEARIVAMLSNDTDLLDKFAKGVDVHKMTAATIFMTTVDKIDTKMRFIGKESRHAGNYDVKKKRFMFMVNSDAKKFGIDINISEWKAGQILDLYATMHPLLDSVFRAGIRDALDKTRVLTNPFGRRRQFFDRLDENMYREGYAQIPQSTVRDQVCKAMVAIKKRIPEVRFCGESHDAFLTQTPEDKLDLHIPIFQEEMETPIDFKNCTLSRGILVIPSDVKIGLNYKDLAKWGKNEKKE